ncbi:MAG: VWA domain-containing protein [Chloroflexi bacterium]|nr:VWA domain-containing protein [Chloroflexota bacterium]
MTEASGSLLHNILMFGRLLRAIGLDLDTRGVSDFVRSLDWIRISQRREFYYAARCLYVSRREDLALFDEAFDWFWQLRVGRDKEMQLDVRRLEDRLRLSVDRSELSKDFRLEKVNQGKLGEPEDGQPQVKHATFTYSPNEMLRRKDFGELSEDELREVKQLMAKLAWRLGERRSRRWRPGKARQVDFRRTLRRNMRNEGELLELARRQLKMRPRPLVVIADISGSMERYTRLLLHFIYALRISLDSGVEAFVFGTRLTRITRRLRSRDVEGTLKEIARSVPDWSGGTRIGQALKTFNYEWTRRVLGHRAVVLLISDGWDRGDIDLLRNEMARLQRSCHRLIWLNPLLGSAEYEPLTRGIQAALPYVDDFLPVHNLASLEELADQLERLDDRRPIRRQQRPELDLQPT